MKPLALSLLLLLGACAGGAAGGGAPRADDQRQQDATTAACRADAERIMRYRDRGQLMRTDEAEARIGAGAFSSDTVAGSMSTQRLSSRYEQSRLVDECVRGANATAPATAPAAAAPAPAADPAPAPAATPTARRARGR